MFAAGASGEVRSVDLVYAEPNVGSSSGGHLAVRFDTRVYHFQHRKGSWLRMERAGWEWFQYAYGVLQNRGLRVRQVETDAAAYRALRDRFNDGYLIERAHFEVLASLGRDVELLEGDSAKRGAAAPPTVSWEVRGAGFFCSAAESAPALARLRGRVADAYGAGVLAERRAALERAMQELPVAVSPIDTAGLRRDRAPGVAARPSERFLDLAQGRVALAALAGPAALCPEVQRAVPGAEGLLNQAERRLVAEFAGTLEDRLVALADSARPDWADPLLLGMARLAALEASLKQGRWVVLDAFPHDARALPAQSSRGGARRQFLQELEADATQRLDHSRRALLDVGRYDERVFNNWEDALNRALELRRGMAEGREIRVDGERLIPEGRKRVEGLPAPRVEEAQAASLLARARDLERRYNERLEGLYRYNLFERNCVTELLRALDVADEDGPLLGGRIDPEGALHFIPAFAFEEAAKRYPRASQRQLPSYRSRRLAAMVESEGRIAVFLRESNTLTSTIYRPNPHDSFFLFFTDDAVWPRPIFGAFNVAAGVGETGWGLLSLPFDRGARLRSGAVGVAFSVPELFFWNFRKGTLEYGRGASAAAGDERPAS